LTPSARGNSHCRRLVRYRVKFQDNLGTRVLKIGAEKEQAFRTSRERSHVFHHVTSACETAMNYIICFRDRQRRISLAGDFRKMCESFELYDIVQYRAIVSYSCAIVLLRP